MWDGGASAQGECAEAPADGQEATGNSPLTDETQSGDEGCLIGDTQVHADAREELLGVADQVIGLAMTHAGNTGHGG